MTIFLGKKKKKTPGLNVSDLYHTLGPYAVSKTHYLVGDMETAREIVHDAFIKLMEKDPHFDTTKAAYAWIYKVCHNLGVDFLRSARKKEFSSITIDEQLWDQPSDPHERSTNRIILQKYLSKLNKRDSQVICYRFIDGMNLNEISEILNISEKTVRRSIKHSLQIIKQPKYTSTQDKKLGRKLVSEGVNL